MAAAKPARFQHPRLGRDCRRGGAVFYRPVCRQCAGAQNYRRLGFAAGAHSGGKKHLFQRKKVSESLLSDSRQSFKTPVLVPFPQADIWTVAFVSGNIPAAIAASLPEGERYLPVYVPTTPNPTGGYYIMVRQRDIRPLNMSVDDALKYVISLGMVMPDTPAQNSIAPPTAD